MPCPGSGTQKITAENLDLTQPRVSDLFTGKISKFSLDALGNIGIKVGLHLRVESDEEQAGATSAPPQGAALL
ncbi:XRE family transcriptional regulator [Corynebacterium lemuris]|uniref:XRE family transcriptional regulator n=1 Tax=Corynebacterium lemuris TaxID=1859292 RepID=UPI003F71D064